MDSDEDVEETLEWEIEVAGWRTGARPK